MSTLLRTTAIQMAEENGARRDEAQSALAEAAGLLVLIAARHANCSADPESLAYCPEVAAAERVATAYVGADAAKELTNA